VQHPLFVVEAARGKDLRVKQRRPWSAWVSNGSVVMAIIAALALGATVLLADRALSEASDIIVRGEQDSLTSTVVSDLTDDAAMPTAASLDRELSEHADEGLRYIAVVGRDGKPQTEAGSAQMADANVRPGQSQVSGHRVRTSAVLFPPRHGFQGAHIDRPPGPPPILVLEFEPPVIEKLRGDLARISVVAAVAGVVLLALAIAWSRSAARLRAVERQTAQEQRLVALGSMSSVMAHELRNPLASLKGHAQLLVEDLEEGKNKTKAERVVAEAERLEVLTTSLLDFVRDGPIDLAMIAPVDLVTHALEHLPADRVTVDVSAAPKSFRVDEARLARAVQNLVQNAIQATPDEGKVDLTISEIGNDVVIAVRDRGPGIPEGSEAQIFEPFMTTRVRGTGLGLPVARRIAEQHHGTLVGENASDGGAVFRLSFPIENA
jgi:two-component system sensor histidine kinase HydH